MSAAILLLDDDVDLLAALKDFLEGRGYTVFCAESADRAEQIISSNQIHCAIVDLFLQGDEGDQLSNQFVRDYLNDTPYIRLTSAPGLVPEEYSGAGVLHKYKFRSNPSLLLDLIIEITASSGT